MNIIEHPQFGGIRTEKHKGEFVFCAKDLVDALEMKQDAFSACQNLDDDEKLNKKVSGSGQNRDMLFVTESGLYALIIRSNKPEARKFRKWITSEVLPALRKYGTYSFDADVMDRAKLKAEKKAVTKLLREIDKKLSLADKRMIAKKCLTTEYHIERVLAGKIEDVYLLSALYDRANGNAKLHQLFYTLEGAVKLTKELKQLITHHS